MKSVLTIAGSDSSGGAGIQADIKTITAHKLFATSAITALTAQNTIGVRAIHNAPPEFVGQQLDAIFEDIRPHAVKIGMVSSPEIITIISQKLRQYAAENIVLDPVMVSTSGSKLLADEAQDNLCRLLLPIATVITPNIPEAQVLSGREINNLNDMEEAAKIIGDKLFGGVLIKGGHLLDSATDLLYYDGEFNWYRQEHIDNPNTHGTGCTLSSAIACNLALGYELPEAIANAKKYLTGALKDGLNLGKGSGPLNHMYCL
ncbi:bifunctional hydroxymethylpyrimidine kinase/phosphomethylpyrimidine kinase [uncultured Anaerovibrio sp.]|uniref:bifunctional hydroxymethylpyrimidine kinase/phosphomethylpyrimidine kinase n=1 Tax=uncultured Anaerovibrio sp. TaxID=361586 RepID=UPI00263A305C|nr:bifunctional hydroxymethylpyrimidine kinase/phosphomethylpyrimidine kinase [uncultured Anaerovibrio sp.]